MEYGLPVVLFPPGSEIAACPPLLKRSNWTEQIISVKVKFGEKFHATRHVVYAFARKSFWLGAKRRLKQGLKSLACIILLDQSQY